MPRMQMERAIEALVISVPVFLVMGLGKLLAVRGWMPPDRRTFVNHLVYYFALPSLIFRGVAGQPITNFAEPALSLVPLAATLLLALAATMVVRVLRIGGGLAAALVFGTFWANVTYLGFPLTLNAFGEDGLAAAGVFNAVVMPLYVLLGYAAIALTAQHPNRCALGKSIARGVFNPVVLAAIFGVAVSAIGQGFRNEDGILQLAGAVLPLLRLADSTLRLVGSMGLPMALLAIGAGLHAVALKRYWKELLAVSMTKLVLLPFLTWALAMWFVPESGRVVLGVSVLLSAMPSAVASYVVARQFDAAEDFVSSLLVVSTGLSVISVPVWLYFLV